MLWDNHWLAMPGEVTEWWNFQSMMVSNTIGYIGYVVKRNVFKHIFFEAYSFRTHTFPHHLSVKVWARIAKMVVWCSEPKEAQRSTACSQHQKQETKMKFAAGGTLCGNMRKPMPLLLAQCPRQRDAGNQLQVSNPWMYCNNPWMQWNGLIYIYIYLTITTYDWGITIRAMLL